MPLSSSAHAETNIVHLLHFVLGEVARKIIHLKPTNKVYTDQLHG